MSQSMNLTKFTTHLDERHSWRHSWWVHIISALQTFREHFVSVGVLSSTQGMWHNKGRKWSAPAQLDEILSVPPLLLPALPALAECLQCVPDESPRASWTEGGERDPRSTRSRRLGGRKGTNDTSAWEAIWNRHCKHVYLTMTLCITWHLLNFLLGLLIKYFECMSTCIHSLCTSILNRAIPV